MFRVVTRERLPEKQIKYAGMAELADALDSGSSEVTFVQVQVLLPAPKKRSSDRRFGLLFFRVDRSSWFFTRGLLANRPECRIDVLEHIAA